MFSVAPALRMSRDPQNSEARSAADEGSNDQDQQAANNDQVQRPFRPRSPSHYLHASRAQDAPSRWWLRTQAAFWRTLMTAQPYLHDYALPKPPLPAFTRAIPTVYDGPNSPPITLYFYVPEEYASRKQEGHGFPVVVNFHGGGFVLGSATDDRYWANVVLKTAKAVLVSVEYRRAPEFAYPTAVDDGVDALLYLSAHAVELGLDVQNIALSGFSAGGNLAFSVPLRLAFHTRKGAMATQDPVPSRWASTRKLLDEAAELRIVNITSFYPVVDWSSSRTSKRRSSSRPDKTLPAVLTDLFDYSYLPLSAGAEATSPFISPSLASASMLADGLPKDIQFVFCGWDMLLQEGDVFAKKLDGLGKNVSSITVSEVVHAWDKSPDPWRDQGAIDQIYAQVCHGMRKSFALGEE